MLPSFRDESRHALTGPKGWTERLLVGACLGAVWGLVVGFLPALGGGLSTLFTIALVGALLGAMTAAFVHLERGRQRKQLSKPRLIAALVIVGIAPIGAAFFRGRGPRWGDWITPTVTFAYVWLVQRHSRA